MLAIEGVPQQLAEWMAAQQFSQATFLILVNLFLLAFGIFIEPPPGVMVLAPFLAPVAVKLGVDPTHLAMIVIVNLTLGMITPPVGRLLFVTANVARVPMSALVRELMPFPAGARRDPEGHHLRAGAVGVAAAHAGLQVAAAALCCSRHMRA